MPNEIIPVGERTRVRDNFCPYCGAHHNAATAAERNAKCLPGPGCIAICLDCGAILTYDEEMRLVVPTAEELAGMQSDAEIWATVMEMSTKFKSAAARIVMHRGEDDLTRRKM